MIFNSFKCGGMTFDIKPINLNQRIFGKSFRGIRNLLRTKITHQNVHSIKRYFVAKKLKVELWRMVHGILNSDPKPIAADPDELNFHFKKTM